MTESIAVVIPTHGREEQAIRALQSVCEQSYRASEVIVIDDGSAQELLALRAKAREFKAHFIRTPQNGVSAARNLGVSESTARYICFLDSDDYWEKDKLLKHVAFHRENPCCRVSQTEERWFRHGEFVNQKDVHQKPSGDAFYASLFRCVISPSSVMIERSLFLELGGFDEEMAVCEDYDLWLRLSCKEQLGYIPEQLCVKFGGHEDQLSKRIAVMDRFRIYAMCKLLLSAELSPTQKAAVYRAVSDKARVVSEGAKKRGYNKRAALFSPLVSPEALEGNELAEHTSVLRKDILAERYWRFPTEPHAEAAH